MSAQHDHIKYTISDSPKDINQQGSFGIIDPVSDVGNNIQILYITFGIIVGLLLLWIIIVVITKEDPVKILGEMNNLAFQISAVNDTKQVSLYNGSIGVGPMNYAYDTSANNIVDFLNNDIVPI